MPELSDISKNGCFPRVARFASQGHLFKCKIAIPLHEFADSESKNIIGGLRSSISRFSSASRKRLLEFFSKLDEGKLQGGSAFLTLTYGQKFPSMARSKRDLDVFVKRLNRLVNSLNSTVEAKEKLTLSYVWKAEFQERGAPHFHIVIFGWRKVTDPDGSLCWPLTKDDFADIWGEVINPDFLDYSDPDNVKSPFTRIEFIYRFRRLMHYVSKYMGKVENQKVKPSTGLRYSRSEYARMSKGFYTGFNSNAYLTAPINFFIETLHCNNLDDVSNYVLHQIRYEKRLEYLKFKNYLCFKRSLHKKLYSSDSVGRFWGVMNRKQIPYAKIKVCTIFVNDELKNVINKMSLAFRHIKPDYLQGFTLFSSDCDKYFDIFKNCDSFKSLDDTRRRLKRLFSVSEHNQLYFLDLEVA